MLYSEKLPTNWMHERETRLLLAGAAGSVEVLVNGVDKPRAIALICHPHPLHGGSLDNKVIFTLARACRDSAVIAVRFNFRGVGRSTGDHDNGAGEVLDAESVLTALHSQLPELPVVLAGFSFGAAIALQLTQKLRRCDGVVLVAPPVGLYGSEGIVTVNVPLTILQCDDDEVVNSKEVMAWFEKVDAPEKNLKQWQEGGHYFHGMLPDLKHAIETCLSGLLV